jgi:non-ribosomal peptide synthetase component E (peptide arylation enzyme)
VPDPMRGLAFYKLPMGEQVRTREEWPAAAIGKADKLALHQHRVAIHGSVAR